MSQFKVGDYVLVVGEGSEIHRINAIYEENGCAVVATNPDYVGWFEPLHKLTKIKEPVKIFTSKYFGYANR